MSVAPSASALISPMSHSIRGKTILVLGSSPNSLGARFLEIIKPAEPGLVILGGRSLEKLQTTAKALSPIPTKTFAIDMLSFQSVRTAAKEVNAMGGDFDVVINNIGSMAAPYYKSEDGYESQLQINHLGFFLFANLIMDKLLTSKTRIVNVSSEGYGLGMLRYHDYNFHEGEVYNPFLGYGQAKTAQILFAAALARRLGDKGLLAYSIQPGFTQGTNLHDSWGPYTLMDMVDVLKKNGEPRAWQPMQPTSADENLANFLIAAFDQSVEKDNGAYIRGGKVIDKDTMKPWAVDERQERRCWDLSEEFVGQKFRYE